MSKKEILRELNLIVNAETKYNFHAIHSWETISIIGCMVKKAGQELKAFVNHELDVSNMTVQRYMTLASIILTYPRLILYELSFAQTFET